MFSGQLFCFGRRETQKIFLFPPSGGVRWNEWWQGGVYT
jgi:hypothetical protein